MSGPPAGVAIRPMTAGDVTAVAALERELYPNPWSRAQFADLIEIPWVVARVAVAGRGEVVGYVVVHGIAGEAEVANLAVAGAWQRRGIGGRLLRDGLDRAREGGARRAHLEVRVSNRAARALYEAHGFTVVGRRAGYYRGPREDALVMAADLGGPARPVDPPSRAGYA